MGLSAIMQAAEKGDTCRYRSRDAPICLPYRLSTGTLRLMKADPPAPTEKEETSGLFPRTRWELISEIRSDRETSRQHALSELCEIYWFPVYTFIRCQGTSAIDAKDMTQELFANLIRRESFALANQKRGRLRNYLKTAASRMIAETWRKQQAEKRGGQESIVSIDADTAEERLGRELSARRSPESELDRQWALALLKQVEIRLEKEFADKGKREHFDLLKPGLVDTGNNPLSQAEIGQRLGLSASAVKQELLRMRRRFRDLVYEEIAGTVSHGDVEEEMAHLFAALRN